MWLSGGRSTKNGFYFINYDGIVNSIIDNDEITIEVTNRVVTITRKAESSIGDMHVLYLKI